ncbi:MULTISPECIES: hypothetical protein [Pseudomonas]|jgi:hypothetical protein|uniref:hypothetical protein n=1 Tax=Pseudomonas TaxID=286 RepID=UPI000483D274|nr:MULTISPECIES: hypothetical protein [Pseudomonas]PRA58556.1 hypothetical protein CQZ98_07935 [Pseudomonas sp. MYb115]QXN50575.1 hypothetical protein KW062_01995 [Pseudomonas fluorescens]WSO24889.1 hypothetical protein VUJ50_02005 [Pseudomonas fluorescens]
MTSLTPPNERYKPLTANAGDAPVLVIDTQANSLDLLEAAQQRVRAASELLETLYCLCFNQADGKDLAHVVSALYLLTQDGSDLLDVVQQQLSTP